MTLIPRLGLHALVLATSVPLLFGCETIKDHVELGAIEMQFEHFDPASSKLEALPPPDTKRSEATVVSRGGKLFFFAGLNTVPEIAADVDIYDPIAKAFSKGAPWPSPTIFAEAFGRADDVCVRNTLDLKTELDCYDTKANAWRTLPLLPNDANVAVGTLGDDLYAVSNDDGANGTGKKAFRLDAAADAWTSISDFPGSCYPNFLRAVDTALYVLPCDKQNQIFRYDPAADTWTSLPLGPEDNGKLDQHVFAATRAVVIAGEVLVYNHNNASTSPIAIFNPATYDMATMKSGVRYSAPLPGLNPGGLATAATSDKFWLADYSEKEAPCGMLHSYDPATDKWTTHATRPTDERVCAGSLGAVGDDVFLLTSLQEKSVSLQ